MFQSVLPSCFWLWSFIVWVLPLGLVRAQAHRESHMATLNALRGILSGAVRAAEQKAPRAVRFLDLSDSVNALPETMNSLFTRGFQPMLSPSDLERNASDLPPADVENME